MVISFEEDLFFQLEQRKVHLHINVSAAEETSAGYRKQERAPETEPDMGTATRWKGGFKGRPVLQKNHSLGVYGQIMPGRGTANGRSLFLLA